MLQQCSHLMAGTCDCGFTSVWVVLCRKCCCRNHSGRHATFQHGCLIPALWKSPKPKLQSMHWDERGRLWSPHPLFSIAGGSLFVFCSVLPSSDLYIFIKIYMSLIFLSNERTKILNEFLEYKIVNSHFKANICCPCCALLFFVDF